MYCRASSRFVCGAPRNSDGDASTRQPIDFKHGSNIGYAFINFSNPLTIVPFIEYFAGRRWGKYSSDKTCALTYARIQVRSPLCLLAPPRAPRSWGLVSRTAARL